MISGTWTPLNPQLALPRADRVPWFSLACGRAVFQFRVLLDVEKLVAIEQRQAKISKSSCSRIAGIQPSGRARGRLLLFPPRADGFFLGWQEFGRQGQFGSARRPAQRPAVSPV